MGNLRVAVLVPEESPAAADQADTFVQALEIQQCLTTLGHEGLTIVFGADRPAVADTLRRAAPDLVVNLVEDVPEGPDQLHVATALLDDLGLPYTGASTAALWALGDKRRVKAALREAGLPTPDELGPPAKAPSPGSLARSDLSPVGEVMVGTTAPHPHLSLGGEVGAQRRVRGPSAPAPPDRRYILKSAIEHASIGLDATSVVAGRAATEAALFERHARLGGPWFAEAYIEGREFNVALLGPAADPLVLPVAEILFLAHAGGRPRIVGYEEKWDAASAAYTATPRVFPPIAGDRLLLAELACLARRTWDLFALSGYARIDLRVDEAGVPYIVDVNANPCLARDAGFCAAAERAGLSQTDVVAKLIETALA
jgi:D-alanine-D-alanine ligase